MLIKSPVHTFAQANRTACYSHAGQGGMGIGMGIRMARVAEGSTCWELSGLSWKLLLFMQHLQQLLLLLQPAKNCFIKCFLLASPHPCISSAFMLMSFEPRMVGKENKPIGTQRTYAVGKMRD